jgi:hypothetical protein
LAGMALAIDKRMAADTVIFQGLMFMVVLPSSPPARIQLRAWDQE